MVQWTIFHSFVKHIKQVRQVKHALQLLAGPSFSPSPSQPAKSADSNVGRKRGKNIPLSIYPPIQSRTTFGRENRRSTSTRPLALAQISSSSCAPILLLPSSLSSNNTHLHYPNTCSLLQTTHNQTSLAKSTLIQSILQENILQTSIRFTHHHSIPPHSPNTISFLPSYCSRFESIDLKHSTFETISNIIYALINIFLIYICRLQAATHQRPLKSI